LVAGPAGASAQTFTAHDSEPVAVSPNGHTVDFDRGDCAQPEDG
jgi:hypothetical protein